MPIEILTVCTGNIVRSPLSELYLRLLLADLSVDLVSSPLELSAPRVSWVQSLCCFLGDN